MNGIWIKARLKCLNNGSVGEVMLCKFGFDKDLWVKGRCLTCGSDRTARRGSLGSWISGDPGLQIQGICSPRDQFKAHFGTH